MKLLFSYNEDKDPPRPECRMDIINPTNRRKKATGITAIADTGADMTIIPESIIDRLGNIIRAEDIELKGVHGNRISLKVYLVDLILGDLLFPRIEVVAAPKEYGIIGRNILNKHKVTFHFKEGCWRLNCEASCIISQL